MSTMPSPRRYVPLPQDEPGAIKEHIRVRYPDSGSPNAHIIGTTHPTTDTISGRWIACVAILLVANTLVLAFAAATLRTLVSDLTLRLEAAALDTRSLPRPDTLFGLMR
ncbi:hypothetical protein C8Q73DRAFT_663003 [Cubamyces lactineus]|nr:hypothetical protein C8Q73DRAFT_663003 [Cubamyces lactineus]